MVALKGISWIGWAFGFAILIVGVWSLYPLKESPIPQAPAAKNMPAQEPPKPLDESDFRAAMLKQLRPPMPVIVQKPVVEDAPIQKVVDPPKITLIATMIGSGSSSAVVRDPKNQTSRVRVGDRLSGALITAIRPSELDIEFEGEQMTITISKKSDNPTGRSGG